MEKIMISDNYKPVKLLGNGNSVNFSFDFPLISENFLQIFREKNGVQSLVGSGEYTVDFNDEGGVVTFNNAPEEGEIIAITRKIPLEQSTPYKTSSGFPADRIEGNFDTQIAIIQQMQEQVDRCVKVLVTGTQTPEELLDEVYTKLDSATEVAQEAVDAANSATQAVESAEKTLSEVTTYVDSSKSEINTLVTDATNSINTTVGEATTNLDNTISQAVNDVKAEAVAAAEGAIQDAANTAVQIATDHANNVIIPPLQEYVDNARESATSAEESSLSASASALSASQSASNAKTSETNAKNSEISAKNSERVLQNLLPSQTSNAGKFLTTNGVNAQWAEVVSSTITYWDERL